MDNYTTEQNIMRFFKLEKEGSKIEEYSSSQFLVFNAETPSITQIAEDISLPQCNKAKKIKKKRQNDFHHKKRRRNNKNLRMNKNRPFNNNEDQKILSLVLENGPKFSIISNYFKDRTQNTIKNRYYKYLRYRWDQILGSDYSHFNQRKDDQEEQEDITKILSEMNFFPEVTSILSKFVQRVYSNFN